MCSGVSPCKGTNPITGDPTLTTSSKLNYLPKVPPPNTIALGGKGFNIRILRAYNSAHNAAKCVHQFRLGYAMATKNANISVAESCKG